MPQVTFKDARSFSLALNRIGRELPAQLVSQVQRKVLLESLESIVDRTPVDIGTARGNWQVTQDSPDVPVLSTADKTGSTTKAAGQAAILALPPYVRAYIANGLPYIEVLEFGGYPKPFEGPRTPQFYSFRKGKDGRRVRVNHRKPKERSVKVTPEGFSTQAPRGMVGITFEEAAAQLSTLQLDDPEAVRG